MKLIGILGTLLLCGYIIWLFNLYNEPIKSPKDAITIQKQVKEVTGIIVKDTTNVVIGKFTEPYRPPVYVGIGPGGPPVYLIKVKKHT
jgi:hypothetical protein